MVAAELAPYDLTRAMSVYLTNTPKEPRSNNKPVSQLQEEAPSMQSSTAQAVRTWSPSTKPEAVASANQKVQLV